MIDPELLDQYGSFAVALAVGALIGMQRAQSFVEQESDKKEAIEEGRPLGGIRTHPLIALAGALAALAAQSFGIAIFITIAIFVLAPVVISFADDVKNGRQRGMTSEVAILLAFLLGALAMPGTISGDPPRRWLLVGSLGIVVTALLSLKERLHAIAARISRDDMYATIKFAIVAIVIVPLLPNEAYGPTAELAVFNPYKIGWMIVLIAGISFIGYIAMRLMGPERGLGVTGFVGGLASSTAVTLSLAQRSKDSPAIAGPCAIGVVLANTIMPMRLMILVALLHPRLLAPLWPPLVAAVLAGFVAALFLRRPAPKAAPKEKGEKGVAVKLVNPFELRPAVRFGLLFALILFIAKLAQIHLGDRGLYVAGLIGGLTDVDAITLSMIDMAKAQENENISALAATVLIAALSNTLFKAAMAISIGAPAFRRVTGMAFAAMTIAAAAAYAFHRFVG